MKKVEILTDPNPILRRKAKKVDEIDENTKKVIENMTLALECSEIEGLAIAAPQIGKSVRIILVRVREQKDKEGNIIQKAIPLTAYINPQITKLSKEKISLEEGCLSCPGLFAEVERPKKVRLEAINIKGGKVKVNASGLLARVFQHEVDHLEGILFIDKVIDKSKIREISPIEREKGKLKDLKNEIRNFKLAFAGGGPFAEPIFAELASKFDNLILISKEDKPKGRSGKSEKSVMKSLAESKNIPVYEPANKADLEEIVDKIKPDLVVVASLGIIITEKTLKMPTYGFVNVHFSLLPLHRGPSPVQFTILSGDKKAGITIQEVVPEIDAGNVIYKYEIDLKGDETTKSLGRTLAEIAGYKLPDVIHDYTNELITPKEQNHSNATFTKIIQKSDGKIDWSEPAEIIEEKVRAYSPWPGTYTHWNGKVLKILEATVSGNESGQNPGTFYEMDSGSESGMTGLYGIQTGKGTLIVNKLQLEGKKSLDVSDFIRGYPDILKSILETQYKR